jgi:hypothetical protein
MATSLPATTDRKRKAPTDTTDNDEHSVENEEDETRGDFKAHQHDETLKKQLLENHARELDKSEAMMQREQNEDFKTCKYV